MNKRDTFKNTFPDKYFLDGDDGIELRAYLDGTSLLTESEKILHTEVPGAGNMNYVIRVRTDRQSIILKQARPWVEKYPQIAAPVERNEIESKFYQIAKQDKRLASHSPQLLFVDSKNDIIVLEDLGSTHDFSFLYQFGKLISEETCISLAQYLKSLHIQQPNSFPENRKMRELNHEHIFKIPFQRNNGISLEDIQLGLSSLTELIYDDLAVIKKAQDLGGVYLSQGRSLIHGDFYPGSWMTADDKLYVLDPEFCFIGPPEFDVAVLLAHLRMSGQSIETQNLFLSEYKKDHDVDVELINQFAGIEIIRRLLGIAQLPLNISIEEKKDLVSIAIAWLTA